MKKGIKRMWRDDILTLIIALSPVFLLAAEVDDDEFDKAVLALLGVTTVSAIKSFSRGSEE